MGIVPFVSAAEVSYCCEKTTYGAWCQNEQQDQCDPAFRSASTSCESTSYCQEGTCYNSNEGTCLENTAQQVCQNNGGLWDAKPADELPQCSLGCCLIGDQASFVTQTRCKRLSSLYGLTTNFRTDITSEIQCIASATSEVKGACVFEKEFEKTCKIATQKECSQLALNDPSVSFHSGFLCSADELATNCGPSEQTTCVDGKDGVYFLDTCGNIANIYDSTKANDPEYWRLIRDNSESCSSGSSNAGSNTCGNCDYFLGSTCRAYQRGTDPASPVLGDNICRSLGCDYLGEHYEHGETWCADSKGTSDVNFGETPELNSLTENLPGSRYYRLLCYNGEVTTEACADYRQEYCLEDKIPVETSSIAKGYFSTASCVVNKWEDCSAQNKKDDCENSDKRDCAWLTGSDFKFLNNDALKLNKDANGVCVPKYAPGLDRDGSGDATSQCDLGTRTCLVTYKKKSGVLGVGETDWEIDNGGECLNGEWAEENNFVCSSLGDCGSTINYVDVQGYNEINDLVKTGRRSKNKPSG